MSLLKLSSKNVYRFSPTQIHALTLAAKYKLQRNSMGWSCLDHPKWGITEPVQNISPVTVKSIWRMGLLDGTPDAQILGKPIADGALPELWANMVGHAVLRTIQSRTGVCLDPRTDLLTYPEFRDSGFITLVLDPPPDPTRPRRDLSHLFR